jgi:acyl-CoA thioester hydrolase
MKKLFFTEERVIFGDTDAMGVAYHANYLRWFERGRIELLREIGFAYSELEQFPVWLPLTQAHCEYKKPARYDDAIIVSTKLAELGFASVVMTYEVTNKKTGDLLVTGYTRHGITDDMLKPLKLKKVYPEFYVALKDILPDDNQGIVNTKEKEHKK